MLEVRRRVPDKSFVATIGKFDGVHKAHQSLISLIVDEAKIKRLDSLVFSLTPNPAYILGYISDRSEITSLRKKYDLLDSLGVNYFCPIRFSLELSKLSAKEFIEEWFINRFHVKKLVFGSDFRMGKQREVGSNDLVEMLSEMGIEAHVIDIINDSNIKIASSKIRELLKVADFGKLEKVLGRRFSLMDKVATGNQIGRTINFPTANLKFVNQLLPPFGVYVTIAKLKGVMYHAVTNIGVRPTVGGKVPLVETHIINHELEPFYGEVLEIEFIKKIRDEIKFSNIDELKKQIIADVKFAEGLFKNDTQIYC